MSQRVHFKHVTFLHTYYIQHLGSKQNLLYDVKTPALRYTFQQGDLTTVARFLASVPSLSHCH